MLYPWQHGWSLNYYCWGICVLVSSCLIIQVCSLLGLLKPTHWLVLNSFGMKQWVVTCGWIFALRVLFTGVSVGDCLTSFALHLTAPDKPAVASLHIAHHLSIVAPPTTQYVTASAISWIPPALTTFGSQNAPLQVLATVVWWAIYVHQAKLGLGWCPANALLAFAEPSLGTGRDFHWIFILEFEGVASLSERRECSPAGPDGTGPRHTMAATSEAHHGRHNLQ